ncbi:MAG: hypothetical protein MUD05_07760 [Candidatus Nanopelagicales bacterium]|jgi:hypothetical protein|nr:hypothetical protein [Candidatus Nanopelagicales bacterium]
MKFVLRAYQWKGEPFVAIYANNRRMGYLSATKTEVDEMAAGLLADVIDLGEVRTVATITNKQETHHEEDR